MVGSIENTFESSWSSFDGENEFSKWIYIFLIQKSLSLMKCPHSPHVLTFNENLMFLHSCFCESSRYFWKMFVVVPASRFSTFPCSCKSLRQPGSTDDRRCNSRAWKTANLFIRFFPCRSFHWSVGRRGEMESIKVFFSAVPRQPSCTDVM